VPEVHRLATIAQRHPSRSERLSCRAWTACGRSSSGRVRSLRAIDSSGLAQRAAGGSPGPRRDRANRGLCTGRRFLGKPRGSVSALGEDLLDRVGEGRRGSPWSRSRFGSTIKRLLDQQREVDRRRGGKPKSRPGRLARSSVARAERLLHRLAERRRTNSCMQVAIEGDREAARRPRPSARRALQVGWR